jgi:hypothetical protein
VLQSIVLGVLLAAPFCAATTGLATAAARATWVPAGRAGEGRERLADVNLALNKCSANAGAYQATILDLAAREGQDALWLGRAEPGPPWPATSTRCSATSGPGCPAPPPRRSRRRAPRAGAARGRRVPRGPGRRPCRM